MAELKAFQVDGYDDAGSVIVFAKRSVVARRNGASRLDIDFESVESCRRRHAYDQYAGQGFVPAEVLIGDGWWLPCDSCGNQVDEYSIEEEDAQKPVFDGADVHCSESCRQREIWRLARQKRSTAAIPRWLRRKWPGATLVSHSASQWANGGRSAYAEIRFPGSQYTASVTLREPDWHQKHNSKIEAYPDVRVCRPDLDAWYRFIGRPDLVGLGPASETA